MLKAGDSPNSPKPKVIDLYPISATIRTEADKFAQLVKSAQKILISSTLTSDGDSIGAQLGLAALCRFFGKKEDDIWIVDQSPVPNRYKFLKGTEKILSWEDYQKLSKRPSFDLGITCDGGVERTGDVAAAFDGLKAILVDHHAIGSERSYDSRLLDLEVSSTCELVYLLLEYFNVPLTRDIAESLYIGIVFDTGFFKHSLTRPRTHFVAAHLIATGIDFSKISDRAILERTWEAQLLLRQMLDNMERAANGRLIVSHWSKKDLDEIKMKDGDQEGMINQLYYTDTVEVVALLTEKETNDVKVSLRSKGSINVAELARSLDAGGGGHVRAAGCTLRMSLGEAKEHVVRALVAALR